MSYKTSRVKVWMMGLLLLGAALFLFAPAAFAQDDQPPIVAGMDVEPAATTPGGLITFTLSLENPTLVDARVSITTTLPSGFEMPLTVLPVGASYDLRSGTVAWSGTLAAGSTRRFDFPGTAPVDVETDGRLVAYANVNDGTGITHLSAEGWAGLTPSAAFSYTLITNDAPAQAESIPGQARETPSDSIPDGNQDNAGGTPVQFINQSQGEGPLSYWWDFGDGTSSTKSNPVHSYSSIGDYTVRLAAVNQKGTGTVEHVITISLVEIPEEEPVAYDFLVSDDAPAVGQPIFFSNNTLPVDVAIRWNFGDGVTSDEPNPTHIYEQPGVYTVSRVLGEGETAIQSTQIVTVGDSPEASIDVSSSSVLVGELITFTAYTSAADVTSYYWDFGNGSTAGHNRVAYSYSTPGDYLVTLAIGNDFGVGLDTLTILVSRYSIYLPMIANGSIDSLPEEAAVEATPETAPEDGQPVAGEQEQPQEPVEETPPANPIPDDPLAQKMLEAINAERAAAGLPALTWSTELARAAQHHSEDMAAYGFTGHYGSNGASPADRVQQASYEGDYAGECTAWGFDDITSAVAWWMTSPPHRVIILSTVATELGGGYGYNPGAPSVYYWTIDFGAR